MPTRKGRIASVYLWSREDGELVTLGQVRSFADGDYGGTFYVTEDRATAMIWATELASGRIPVVTGDET